MGKVASTYPEDFAIHPNLKRVLRQRGEMVKAGAAHVWSPLIAFSTWSPGATTRVDDLQQPESAAILANVINVTSL